LKVKMSLLLTGMKLSVFVWVLPLLSCSGEQDAGEQDGANKQDGGKPHPYISEM
jgi:hypothetical protein